MKFYQNQQNIKILKNKDEVFKNYENMKKTVSEQNFF